MHIQATMYKLIFSVFLFFHLCVHAQQPKKPAKPQEKPPTQKEMEDLMKQAQQMMKQLTPEEKKLIEDANVKLPSFNSAPKVGDKALAEAYIEDGKVVPAKRTSLINAMPKTIMRKDELINYVRKTNGSVASLIQPGSKQMADMVMDQFKNDPYYGYMIASAANGMWVANYKESATYLMGKAVEVIPNADHLNNYAAYLTMGGAAHIAIPILNTLNSVHKSNSTILNNLGQAWLQLGDETKAEKYLDSAVMIYANHPQANYTKCLLLQERGRTAEAIAALNRSLKHSVTGVKLNKLRELEADNYKPRRFHVPRVYYSTTFNLQDYVTMVPKVYAMSLGGNIEEQWIAFRQFLKTEIAKIETEMVRLSASAKDAELSFFQKAKASGGNIYAPYHAKAVIMYNEFMKEYRKREEEFGTISAKHIKEVIDIKVKFNADYEKVNQRTSEQVLAGANIQQNCAEQLPVINNFLNRTNSLNQKFNEDFVQRLLTDFYNLYYYYPSTANTDESAQLFVLSLRAGFLSQLYSGLRHESDLGYPCASDIQKKEEYSILKPLDDFDEVNCSTFNWIYTPGLGAIVMRCNTMSLHLNPIMLPFEASLRANFDGFVEQASIGIKVKGVDIKTGAEFDQNGNFEKGTVDIGTTVKGIDIGVNGEFDEKGFKKGSVEMGIDNELKLLPKSLEEDAPVEVSLKNELGIGMELSRGEDGMIADFVVKEKTEAEFAPKVEIEHPDTIVKLPSAPSVSVSADNRWSVNSGYSAQGSSSLSKLK